MSKRKKGGGEAKELGGAQKLRLKRKKMLEQDAAKCAKLTDHFRGKAKVDGDASVSETNGEAGTGHSNIAMTGALASMFGNIIMT